MPRGYALVSKLNPLEVAADDALLRDQVVQTRTQPRRHVLFPSTPLQVLLQSGRLRGRDCLEKALEGLHHLLFVAVG